MEVHFNKRLPQLICSLVIGGSASYAAYQQIYLPGDRLFNLSHIHVGPIFLSEGVGSVFLCLSNLYPTMVFSPFMGLIGEMVDIDQGG